jgi:hypothetical protein
LLAVAGAIIGTLTGMGLCYASTGIKYRVGVRICKMLDYFGLNKVNAQGIKTEGNL